MSSDKPHEIMNRDLRGYSSSAIAASLDFPAVALSTKDPQSDEKKKRPAGGTTRKRWSKRAKPEDPGETLVVDEPIEDTLAYYASFSGVPDTVIEVADGSIPESKDEPALAAPIDGVDDGLEGDVMAALGDDTDSTHQRVTEVIDQIDGYYAQLDADDDDKTLWDLRMQLKEVRGELGLEESENEEHKEAEPDDKKETEPDGENEKKEGGEEKNNDDVIDAGSPPCSQASTIKRAHDDPYTQPLSQEPIQFSQESMQSETSDSVAQFFQTRRMIDLGTEALIDGCDMDSKDVCNDDPYAAMPPMENIGQESLGTDGTIIDLCVHICIQ